MNVDPILLLFASIFTSNVVLTNFLGMCSYISISKDLVSASGLGMAVTFVMTITTALNWFVYHHIIVPLNIEYLRFIIFIIVIASVVQILEMLIDRVSPALYMSLGIFLPLITVNCAILGVTLFMQIRNYNFIQSLVYGLGGGLGWWLAIVSLAAIRKKIDNNPVPPGLKGTALTMVTIGIMAMAFMGFAGMIRVQ